MAFDRPAALLNADRLLHQGRLEQAIERLAEAPAPSAEEGHQLIDDLADVLESSGERDRALAVWVELRSDAGTYRDVAKRIQQVAGARSRG